MAYRIIEKAAGRLLIALVAGLVSTLAVAQLPELGNPVAISGQPTTARFFGGATADGGASFLDTYSPDDALDFLGEIRVEASHVGSIGDLYVVGIMGELLFTQVEDGSFAIWEDGGALLPRATSIPLAAEEQLTIIQGLPFGAIGITDETIYFFLAYTTQQQPGELYFSGVPIAVTIAANSVDTFQLYQDTISQPIIQSTCIQCHVAGEQAQGTRLVYQFSGQAGYLQSNFETLTDFILNTSGGSQAILSKPLGIAHGGGPQLTENSSEYVALTEFVAAVLAGSGGGDDDQALFDGVDLPELGNPVATSGQPTTARFFGGATADGGASFLDTYSPDDALYILGEIKVEPGHVGSIGDLYVVGIMGEQLFMQVEDGSFAIWEDGGALLPRAASISLAAKEQLAIIKGLPFGAIGITDETIYYFLVYTTQEQPGALFFSGVPIAVTIAESP
jgi:hypothetical protein